MFGRRLVPLLTLIGTLALAGPALASGGSGGGGTGGGGGGTKPPCTSSITVSAAATEALTGNAFQASYVLASCQSKTKVSMTATDLSTGATVWASIADLNGTTAFWTLPYTLTTYRIDARAYSGTTGATLATGSTTVATMDAIPCDPMVSEAPTVGYYGIYPAIWANTDGRDCGLPGSSIRLRITNLDSGVQELQYSLGVGPSVVDYEGAVVSYDTPYRVDADLVDSSGTVLYSATATVRSSVLR